MKKLLAWLAGLSSALFQFLLPLLKSEAGKILSDPEVQALALECVQLAATAKWDKGDSKHTQATADLMERLRTKGRAIGLGVAATVIEAAYHRAKADGSVQ